MKPLLGLCFCVCATASAATAPVLVQKPAVNQTQVVFAYAGDLWSVPRQGGEAIRLTTGAGNETNPVFSPDGTQIAFMGEYDGNSDVYVIPAAGGVPKRLTYHPSQDVPVAWTADGKSILFRSNRNSYSRFARLFTVPVEGGFPSEVNLPTAEWGSYSPDGSRLAYLPIAPAFEAWKRYRGGRTTPIWLANLADGKTEAIPRSNSNDVNPMWIGQRVYFLSDRNGPFTLFYYDLPTKKVVQAVKNDGLDIKSASAGPGVIAYEQFGSIHLYDLKTGDTKPVDIRISGDIPTVRPTFEKVSGMIQSGKISPTGARAVFQARGEILTVPAEKGDVRNLTNTSGVAERDPAWSPDGKLIAYFSDESGEYQLHLRQQNGMGDVHKVSLGDPPTFYYEPRWAPDSKKIAYTTQRLELWCVDLEKKTPVRIDQDTYETPFRDLNPVFSPDSKWIAYTKLLKNHFRAVFLYSLETGKAYQITDGLSDAEYAAFDANGKYLYFTASTNMGLTTGWLDMSSDDHRVSRSAYVVVLNKNDPSPLAPESDDEKAEPAEKEKPAEKSKPVEVKIDLENIDQRILALPVPERDYGGMAAGKTGVLFLMEAAGDGTFLAGWTVQKFDLKTRKTEKFLDGVQRVFEVSHNGEKVLYRQGQGAASRWFIAGTAAAPKPGEGALKTDGMEVRIDPQQEWAQIYREVWRIERDFFYDPGLHGLNAHTASEKYTPYFKSVASRADLNYLLTEMLGELSVGHLFVSGGSMPPVKRVPVGLLGADYAIENGRFKFAKVYNGENWNPQLKAPLTQPGVNVKTGEYLLAVSGHELRAPENVYSLFEETAGKSVVIRVGPNSDGSASREVTVVPVENEYGLRNLAWIEENRRKVDQMSGGRLAYVYLPDTAGGGFRNFNRYYFAQIGKQGAVIDERFNGGGQVADYIVDHLNRPLLSYWSTRYGEPFTTPQNEIFGPKAMIINEYAGSGGDALPWMFRQRHVGKLIGKRTWGGLVGIFGAPALIDGGSVTAPNLAFWNPLKTDWEIENHGVPPDIEVEYDPAAVRAGHDPQLEKAVEVLLAEIKQKPAPVYKHPPYPNYHQGTVSTGGSK